MPVEVAVPSRPHPEIFYPPMTRGTGLNVYPLLIFQQPWFSPDGMHNWPLLLDVDRTPFTAWDKRVGQ